MTNMPSKPSPSQKLRALEIYLRTGRHLLEEEQVETKFNPWHDPDDGRFTFAGRGIYVSPGGASRAGTSRSAARSPDPSAPTRRWPSAASPDPAAPRASDASRQFPATSLSRAHREFLAYEKAFPAKAGTQDEWVDRGSAGISKARFKDQYISGHSNVFRAAAKRFDVPVELVASVAHVELGNDDMFNDLAYAFRSESGRNFPVIPSIGLDDQAVNKFINRPRDETSFGPYGIQQRRAAEILGYGDINKMSETARRALIPTSRAPVPATFMLAKHLSDLRDLDFPGVAGKDLTRDQMLVMTTRYRLGPEASREAVLSNIKSGNDYLSRWRRVQALMGSR